MANLRKKPLRLVVTPFSGDPEFLEFFTEQCNAVISGSGWSDEQALTFVKSKLADQALKFYITSPTCKKAKTSSELFTIFQKHFKADSANSIAIQYNNIKFDSTETILTFANRLENIIRKRFPDLPDPSIEQILIAKFTDLIPPHLKLYLFTQKLTAFEEIVEATSSYQEIMQSVQPTNNSTLLPISHHSLQNIDAEHSTHSRVTSPSHAEHLSHTRTASPSNSAQSYSSRNNSFHTNDSVHHFRTTFQRKLVCQWCHRIGHSAAKCFKLKRNKAANSHSNDTHKTTHTHFRKRPFNSNVSRIGQGGQNHHTRNPKKD